MVTSRGWAPAPCAPVHRRRGSRKPILLLLLMVPFGAAAAQARPDSTVPQDLPGFTRWVLANAPTLTPDQQMAAREEAYWFIDQRVRELAWNDSTLPRDSSLAGMFLLASKLGAVGARDVAHAVLSASFPGDTTPVAAGVTFRVRGSMFSLVDRTLGWSVRFPVYFMVSQLDRQVLADGHEYLLTMLSTDYAANDTLLGGSSQATVLLLASSTLAPTDLAGEWGVRLGVQAARPPSDLGREPAEYLAGADPNAHLRKELLVFPLEHGALGLAYIGLEGTYQANRAAFLRLVGTLEP